ncbi:permease transporter, MFS family [Renibacterium salmoninarum ATCC 33209]|uniref:Permease transporter, MFS family n=2 Tax=Renibacterium salmoninarum TaxID=1646 RepID=A9WSW2_RENSM|nr:permease transporter, MFS family [Renibacterium salmoninarum ATCC 33209]
MLFSMTSILAPSALAEPTRKVTGRWITLFAVAWFGIWMAQLAPVQLLLPAQIQDILQTSEWVTNVVTFGIISGIAGVCALIAYPLTGALSDRTTSRFGRRRPWIAVGTLVFAIGLLLLSFQQSMVGVGIFWSISLIGFCILTAALTACISDQVPVNQRGFVSGWMSAPQAVGVIVGLVLVTALFVDTIAGYAAMAVLLVIFVAPFLILMPDARLDKGILPPLTMRTLIEGFWISPRVYADFGWTLLSRILVNVGNALGTSLLLFFLEFGLKMDDAQD